MQKPTILFCDDRYLELLRDPYFKSGGATKQVFAWVEGLMARGVSVKVSGAHSDRRFFENHEQTIISYDPEKGIPKLRYLYVRIPGLIKAMIQSRAKYVYYGVPSAYAGVIALCSVLLGKRFILRVSNDFFVDDRARKQFDLFRYLWFRLGFSLADHILCQNAYQLECLTARYPKKVAKISNPYLGTVSEKPVPFQRRRCIAWIGIFQHQKNLPLLLELARALPELTFRVAGGNDKKLKARDQAALDGLRKLPNVELAGFLDRQGVLDLLDESYMLLNTSHYEGFSNTFLEAFSRGTPVFTLPHNDPDGVIQRNGLGEVFEDSSDAIRRLREFCGCQEAFDRASQNCLRYMHENHDLARQSEEFLRLIEWQGEVSPCLART